MLLYKMISLIPSPTNITTPYYGLIPEEACSIPNLSTICQKICSFIQEEFNPPPSKANPAASENYVGQACGVSCALSSDAINCQI